MSFKWLQELLTKTNINKSRILWQGQLGYVKINLQAKEIRKGLNKII